MLPLFLVSYLQDVIKHLSWNYVHSIEPFFLKKLSNLYVQKVQVDIVPQKGVHSQIILQLPKKRTKSHIGQRVYSGVKQYNFQNTQICQTRMPFFFPQKSLNFKIQNNTLGSPKQVQVSSLNILVRLPALWMQDLCTSYNSFPQLYSLDTQDQLLLDIIWYDPSTSGLDSFRFTLKSSSL